MEIEPSGVPALPQDRPREACGCLCPADATAECRSALCPRRGDAVGRWDDAATRMMR